MRKSNYLILSPFYLEFNDYLTKIENVTSLFSSLTIFDISRFDNLIDMNEKISYFNNKFTFIYLPKNIKKIDKFIFAIKNIQILDLSNNINLNAIMNWAFEQNQIKHLKLPISITMIGRQAFEGNLIRNLDLSNLIYLKIINESTFENNQIEYLKLPPNITEIEKSAFSRNQIEILDLSNYVNLNKINSDAFLKNPLKEIKILDNLSLSYVEYRTSSIWDDFIKYYNNNNKKSGDYKLENEEWKWYPLQKSIINLQL
jgi:hypothetical protein